MRVVGGSKRKQGENIVLTPSSDLGVG